MQLILAFLHLFLADPKAPLQEYALGNQRGVVRCDPSLLLGRHGVRLAMLCQVAG